MEGKENKKRFYFTLFERERKIERERLFSLLISSSNRKENNKRVRNFAFEKCELFSIKIK